MVYLQVKWINYQSIVNMDLIFMSAKDAKHMTDYTCMISFIWSSKGANGSTMIDSRTPVTHGTCWGWTGRECQGTLHLPSRGALGGHLQMWDLYPLVFDILLQRFENVCQAPPTLKVEASLLQEWKISARAHGSDRSGLPNPTEIVSPAPQWARINKNVYHFILCDQSIQGPPLFYPTQFLPIQLAITS